MKECAVPTPSVESSTDQRNALAPMDLWEDLLPSKAACVILFIANLELPAQLVILVNLEDVTRLAVKELLPLAWAENVA